MGEDRSLWNDRCGFFLPGGPFSTEAGLEAMDGAPNYDRVRANLQAAGYKGERVVFVVPTDLPSLNAFSEIAADMFRRVGVNLDYQASDWGSVAPRLANKEGLDKGGWSVWCNNIPGIIAVTPATQSYTRGIGRAGTFGWPESARLEELRDQFLDADYGRRAEADHAGAAAAGVPGRALRAARRLQPAVRLPPQPHGDAEQLPGVLQCSQGLTGAATATAPAATRFLRSAAPYGPAPPRPDRRRCHRASAWRCPARWPPGGTG